MLRPAAAWTDRNNPLHRSVGAIRFDDIGASDALQIVVALFGQDLHPSQRNNLRETKRFNLDVPPGSVIEALNAIVRVHGVLTWGVEPWPPAPTAPGTVLSPFMTSLVNGRAGAAVGIGVHLDREPRVPEQVDRWGRPEPLPRGPMLDRVVGRKATGEPLILHGAHDVPELARAARVAMGLELLPPGDQRAGSEGVKVTGLSLRDALTALMALDPRYEWRELDGVVVVRPLLAWTQPDHPLSRETGPARLENATVIDAVNYLQALLEPGPALHGRTRSRRRGAAHHREHRARNADAAAQCDRALVRRAVLDLRGAERARHAILRRAQPPDRPAAAYR